MDLFMDEDTTLLGERAKTCEGTDGTDYNAVSRCVAEAFDLIDSDGDVDKGRMEDLIDSSDFSEKEKKYYRNIVKNLSTWEGGLEKYCTKRK